MISEDTNSVSCCDCGNCSNQVDKHDEEIDIIEEEIAKDNKENIRLKARVDNNNSYPGVNLTPFTIILNKRFSRFDVNRF